MSNCAAPVGVVLAGGQGRRLGGDKASVLLGGKPLISYTLATLGEVLDDVVVVVKPGTRLPPLDGVSVWTEPDGTPHPLVGIVTALERADGRRVLICGCDLPLLQPASVERLVAADLRGAPAAVAVAAGGRPQPPLGCYLARALPDLQAVMRERPDVPLRQAVGALDPRWVEVADEELFNVNTPQDLGEAYLRLFWPSSGACRTSRL